jgi:hypothetical protein
MAQYYPKQNVLDFIVKPTGTHLYHHQEEIKDRNGMYHIRKWTTEAVQVVVIGYHFSHAMAFDK